MQQVEKGFPIKNHRLLITGSSTVSIKAHVKIEELTYLQRTAVWRNRNQAWRAHPNTQIEREKVRRLRCKTSSMELNVYVPQFGQEATCHWISEGQCVELHIRVLNRPMGYMGGSLQHPTAEPVLAKCAAWQFLQVLKKRLEGKLCNMMKNKRSHRLDWLHSGQGKSTERTQRR